MVALYKVLHETVITCLDLRGGVCAENSHFEKKKQFKQIFYKGNVGEMQKQFLLSHLALMISVENVSRAVSGTVEEAIRRPLLLEY